MEKQNWIKSPENIEGAALAFRKDFSLDVNIVSATRRRLQEHSPCPYSRQASGLCQVRT